MDGGALTRQTSRVDEVRGYLENTIRLSPALSAEYANRLVDEGYDCVDLIDELTIEELTAGGLLFKPGHARKIEISQQQRRVGRFSQQQALEAAEISVAPSGPSAPEPEPESGRRVSEPEPEVAASVGVSLKDCPPGDPVYELADTLLGIYSKANLQFPIFMTCIFLGVGSTWIKKTEYELVLISGVKEICSPQLAARYDAYKASLEQEVSSPTVHKQSARLACCLWVSNLP